MWVFFAWLFLKEQALYKNIEKKIKHFKVWPVILLLPRVEAEETVH